MRNQASQPVIETDKPEVPSHVFVYGTLRPGCMAHRKLEGTSEHIGTYRVPGRIYDLGSFPGVRFGEPNDVYTFSGDLLRIHNDCASEVLARLDSYEGYNPDNPENSLYIRRIIEVDGVSAYCYEFNRQVAGTPIRSGDWFQRDEQ